MKRIILTSIAFAAISLSCTNKITKQEPKRLYKIEGYVEVDNKMHDAIWYTDTVYFVYDSVCYDNSDGSKVRIAPPYTINKYE